MTKKQPQNYGTKIPQYEIEALARSFLPKIQKNFESEEGMREYEEWVQQQRENTRTED